MATPEAPALPNLAALDLAKLPSAELRAAAARLGVARLNCQSCACGYEDTDGEPGAAIYCGMTCSRHELPNTYLEDNGVNIETEKSCWRPDFWKSETPEIMAMIDHTDASLKRANKAWSKLLAEIMPKNIPAVASSQ